MTKSALAIALAASLAAAPAFARKYCDELKAEIDAKLKEKGVVGYTLEVVANEGVADQKVVGSCDGGTQEDRLQARRLILADGSAGTTRTASGPIRMSEGSNISHFFSGASTWFDHGCSPSSPALALAAQAEEAAPAAGGSAGGSSFKSSMKRMGSDIGDAGKKVGKEFAKAGKQVGQGTAKAVKYIGQKISTDVKTKNFKPKAQGKAPAEKSGRGDEPR